MTAFCPAATSGSIKVHYGKESQSVDPVPHDPCSGRQIPEVDVLEHILHIGSYVAGRDPRDEAIRLCRSRLILRGLRPAAWFAEKAASFVERVERRTSARSTRRARAAVRNHPIRTLNPQVATALDIKWTGQNRSHESRLAKSPFA